MMKEMVVLLDILTAGLSLTSVLVLWHLCIRQVQWRSCENFLIFVFKLQPSASQSIFGRCIQCCASMPFHLDMSEKSNNLSNSKILQFIFYQLMKILTPLRLLMRQQLVLLVITRERFCAREYRWFHLVQFIQLTKRLKIATCL